MTEQCLFGKEREALHVQRAGPGEAEIQRAFARRRADRHRPHRPVVPVHPDLRPADLLRAAAVTGNRVLTNHNKLLWRVEGCIGVKTGYTQAAGRILVSAAERGGRTIIIVTIDDPDDWRDHERLYEWFFRTDA